eukprot:m.1015508 g.1015508  ORF g.1015508 m.1015508 type:complete len:71 (-) comp24077_c0_seq14:1306-1518(-)
MRAWAHTWVCLLGVWHLGCSLQVLPREPPPQEVQQHVPQSLEVVAPCLCDPVVGVDAAGTRTGHGSVHAP